MENEISMIEEARQVAKEVREATAELKRVLEEVQKEQVRQVLSGRSEAGASSPPVDIEKQKTDALNERLKETGLHI